jgi:hypothetical protein
VVPPIRKTSGGPRHASPGRNVDALRALPSRRRWVREAASS